MLCKIYSAGSPGMSNVGGRQESYKDINLVWKDFVSSTLSISMILLTIFWERVRVGVGA